MSEAARRWSPGRGVARGDVDAAELDDGRGRAAGHQRRVRARSCPGDPGALHQLPHRSVVLQSPAGKLGDRIGHAPHGGGRPGCWWRPGRCSGTWRPSWGADRRPDRDGGRRSRSGAGHGGPASPWPPARATWSSVRRLRRDHGAGAALGPVVGGELVDAFGWRSLFAANLPVLAVSVGLGVFAGRVANRDIRVAPPRFDWVGSLLLAAA